MAQLGLAVVGYAVGAMIGGPVGGQIGFAIGAYAGGVVERSLAKPIEGPRLSDLGVSASTYGLVIPEIRGSVRLPGNMIWSTGLREHRKKTGEAMKGPTQNTYTYDASFAFGFCSGGEEYEVLRIWADNKLAFDRTGSGEAIGAPGLRFRFHRGDEFQLPDSAIVAAKGADAPAYRGLAYIVFEDVPLAAFGNRIPSITAEIATKSTAVLPAVEVTNLTTGDGNPLPAPEHAGDWAAVDWERRIALRSYSDSGFAIGVSDISSGVEMRVKTMAQIHENTVFPDYGTEPRVMAISSGGAAYYAGWNPSSSLTRFDPLTLTATGQHPFVYSATNWDRHDQLQGCGGMATARILREGSPRELLLYSSIYGNVRIIDAGSMVSIWGMTEVHGGETDIVGGPDYPFRGGSFSSANMCGGEQRLAETDVWLLTSGSALATGSTDDKKPRLALVVVGSEAGFAIAQGQSAGMVYQQVATLDPAVIHPSASVVVVSGLQYDPSDDCLVFVSKRISGGGDAWRLVKVDRDGALVWTTALNGDPRIPSGTARLDGTVYAAMADAVGQLVDLRDGTVRTVDVAEISTLYAFDGISRSIVTLGSPALLTRSYVDRAAGQPVAVADIVTWLCGRAGLAEADADVSLLSGDVRGLAAGQEAARDSLGQLATLFSFDGVETDDALRFIPRGGAVVATIPYEDLVRRSVDQPAIVPTRTAELELPRRLTVQFRDADKDQQSGAQQWARKTAPTPLVSSREEATLNLQNIVLTASEAKTVARVRGTTTWAERTAFDNLTLTPEYLGLEAADPVTLTMQDGTTLRVRLDRVEVQSDFSIRCRALTEDASLYDLTAAGDGGQGHEVQTVPAPYATRLMMGAIPLLEDTDDAGGVALRGYVAGGGYGGQNWLGARLFYSADLAQWQSLLAVQVPMTWGTALGTLAAPISAFLTDRTNTLRVAMQSGGDDLLTVPELQMLAGANRALLLGADGGAELIGFADVTANGDGSFTLGTLLRGQRGTEWACGDHAPGDMFVLVDSAIEPFALALGDLGQTRNFRMVGRFDSFDGTPVAPRTITGAAEKPFAPVQIEGARDGSSNLTVTWERRSRIGGEWLDGTEAVPLGEDTEEYEVDVMNGSAVVRTIEGLTSATAPYSAADQVTDFGSAQPAIAVNIYQISATVGRGYAGSATV